MRLFILGLLLIGMTGCAASSPAVSTLQLEATPEKISADNPTPSAAMMSDLPVIGTAPEFQNEVWLNVDQPLRLADLRGKVVLLDMWTFGCSNCQNVIPSLKGWHEKYGSQGLIVIGNHFPEFEHERSLENLKEAVQRLEIPYAITQDNDGSTWKAYNNSFWPTLYLIDKKGQIRYQYIGEGAYAETENAIRELLAEGS
ncbi:MAG: redoxin domain-containing protein [Anaerolineaceae bacterium]